MNRAEEETPTKGATIADLRALEVGCAGERPIDLRDQAMVAVLITTAARNSSVRLLRLEDVDLDRAIIRFRRAKGGKTLEIALHDEVRQAHLRYLDGGRPGLLAGSARTRPIEPLDDPGWLFVAWGDRSGRPLSANAECAMYAPVTRRTGRSRAAKRSRIRGRGLARIVVDNATIPSTDMSTPVDSWLSSLLDRASDALRRPPVQQRALQRGHEPPRATGPSGDSPADRTGRTVTSNHA